MSIDIGPDGSAENKTQVPPGASAARHSVTASVEAHATTAMSKPLGRSAAPSAIASTAPKGRAKLAALDHRVDRNHLDAAQR